MSIITPNKEFVKQKNNRGKRETLLALCCSTFTTSEQGTLSCLFFFRSTRRIYREDLPGGFTRRIYQEDSAVSVDMNDINLAAAQKNAVELILTSVKGDSDAPLEVESRSFWGMGGGGESPLLDTYVISRYVDFTGVYR